MILLDVLTVVLEVATFIFIAFVVYYVTLFLYWLKCFPRFNSAVDKVKDWMKKEME